MDFKFAQDLFLEKEELDRFKKSLGESGWNRFLMQSVTQYGVVYTEDTNALKVSEGTTPDDLTIQAGAMVDENGNTAVVESALVDFVVQPSDDVARLLVIRHAYKTTEVGTVNISTDGTMTGTGTLFTEVLRGQNNFPIKIKFPDSSNNTQEYVVQSVTSDTSALLNASGLVVDTGVEYEVIGTFSPGVSVPEDSKRPYQYDSYEIELISGSPSGGDLVLATVQTDGATTVIDDERKGLILSGNVEGANTLIHNISSSNGELIVPKEGNYFLVTMDWPSLGSMTYRPAGEELFLRFQDGSVGNVNVNKPTSISNPQDNNTLTILNPIGSSIQFIGGDVAHFISAGGEGWHLVNIPQQVAASSYAERTGANTFTGANIFQGNTTFENGVTENGVKYIRKEVQIGAWDMDTVASVNVAHGIVGSTIRDVRVMIIEDGAANYYPFADQVDGDGGDVKWDSTNIVLTKKASGFFDTTNFNGGGNRGYVTITYAGT